MWTRSLSLSLSLSPFLSFVSDQVAHQFTSFSLVLFPPPFVPFFFLSIGSKRIDRDAFSMRAPSIPPFSHLPLVIDNVFVIRLERPNGKFDQPEKMTTGEKWRAFAVHAGNRVDPI